MWLVLILVALGLWAVLSYNSLVGLRERVKNAWSQVDVQLKRRYDLVPNLVNTVKAYAQHERDTFDRITQARTQALTATTPEAHVQAENELTGALRTLFAVAEAYPELKADANFRELQQELGNTESKIAFARQFYNDTVQKFNIRIQVFPT